MTPLIDIVFQLFAFFVFALSFEPSPLRGDVDPPVWDGIGVNDGATAPLIIELGGSIGSNHHAELRIALGQISSADDRRVVIRADRKAPYGVVRQVLEKLVEEDILNIGLQVKDNEAAR